MRIITGILSIIGIVVLVALAFFGGVYLWNEYSPSSVGSSADRPSATTAAKKTETTQQAQSPPPAAPGETASGPPGSSSASAPPQVPAGYILEDCQRGIGATGKTIYFRPPLEPGAYGPGLPMHGYLYMCVHPVGGEFEFSPTGPSGPPMSINARNPYCAFSTVSRNIGCALEPITSKDLMNPS